MGYDLHITRREPWFDEAGERIEPGEWLTLVARDAELELRPGNGPHFAVCRREGEPGEQWLDWVDGNLYTKSPEQWFVAKMLELAGELGARVVGDEGEEYTRENLDELLPDGAPEPDEAQLPARVGAPYRWLRRLLRHRPPLAPAPPYRVGDRVRDVFGDEATVVKLQRTAEMGAGFVEVEYDDGRRSRCLLVGQTYEPVGPQDA